MRRVVITYGTFDLFHVGHLNILRRLKELGDYLIVGVSTDEFNTKKNKQSLVPFAHRAEIVANLKFVDMVIPEIAWDQKESDILKYHAKLFGMGSDWQGKFDHLKKYCEVVYLPRTEGVSSTEIKSAMKFMDKSTVGDEETIRV